jgi:hypothetical protein
MGALIYVARAFVLLVCCFSPVYRAKTVARWKKSPPHRIVLEVGGGLVGLLILIGIVLMIAMASK